MRIDYKMPKLGRVHLLSFVLSVFVPTSAVDYFTYSGTDLENDIRDTVRLSSDWHIFMGQDSVWYSWWLDE
jgi:hypothetical protein